MRLSQLLGNRFKERPAEAMLESHVLLLRGGYARQVANGIYTLLPPGLRVVRKIEGIVREEMDRIGGQEILMPVVLPKELWEETGRYGSVGSELLRFTDRTGHGMILAMTHEEAVVSLCRNEVKSHAQLPFMVYQIQTKFRDEPRSRGGLIRAREFTMKDAYSFHAAAEDLERFYYRCHKAYARIFARVGLPDVVSVESDTGMMGGNVAHEFELLCDVGEDTIAVCDSCSHRANLEVAQGRFETYPAAPLPLEKVHTPGMKTIEEVAGFLGVEPRQTAKVVFYESDSEGKLVVLLVRGDLEVSEAKVLKIIGTLPVPASEARIASVGAVAGFATAMGLDNRSCRIIVDKTVAESNNLVCGANETDYHCKNFNLERDLPGMVCVDVAVVTEGAGCPACEGELRLRRGIEVGNIFQLGTKYSESMGMTFTDANGKACLPHMGCYGIGIGRLMSAVMETHRDSYGPKWPMSVAPWQVHLNALKRSKPAVLECAERLYGQLHSAGVEVLYDDRDATPGVQFADADLFGIPIRLIVSERNLAAGVVEYKLRGTGETGTIALDDAVTTVEKRVADALCAADP
jgi:prolyl-tRNA synthetase